MNGNGNGKKKAVHFRVISLYLIFFALNFSISALDRTRTISQFYHSAWTAKDGAPSQISALAQTADGFLWIGSALGLYRFDGVQFEQYEPPDDTQFPSRNIYSLLATPDGGLWISFRPSGLGFLKDGKLQIFSRPEEIPQSQVYDFARTPDGRIWAGTHSGLSLFNGNNWIEIDKEWNFKPERVRAMLVDRGGTLWISKEDSVVFLPPNANVFQELVRQNKENIVLQFSQAKDDSIWAVDIGYFVKTIRKTNSDGNGENIRFYVEANGICFDRDGSLWIGSGEFVKRISFPESLINEPFQPNDSRIEVFKPTDGLSGSAFDNILEDREGNIWIGTTKGLDRFRYSPIVPLIFTKEGQKLTLSIGENGELWAGSAILDFIMHFKERKYENIALNPKETYISSVYRDKSDVTWWGAKSGIIRQQNKELKFYPSPSDFDKDYVWEVFRGENDGGVWLNFGEAGLIYFKDGVWERRKPPEGLPNRGPSASFEDAHGRIWLGYTENRVFLSDGQKVQGYSNADGIEIGRIKVIRGRSGNYWFGGELGLAGFKDGRFFTVKTKGKQIGAVSGIVITESGDLWLNETRGIVKIDREETAKMLENPDYSVNYRLFDFQDNLPGGTQMNFTVSTAIEASDGRLWFATDNGLAIIDPKNLIKNTVPPPVTIRSLVSEDKNYALKPAIKLPAGTSELQINYTALSLSIPERVEFKYRLEGLEDHWREAGNRREAFYTNLSPGKYRFQVIAANHDGLWNEQGAILEFEILPRFYQTYWFLLLCFAAATIIAYMLYQRRLHKVKSRLYLLYEERLSERTRIAQELHDTLLQGVLSVSMQINVANKNLPDDSSVKPRLNRAIDLLKEVIEEGRDALQNLRIYADNKSTELEILFEKTFQQFSGLKECDFRIIVEGTKRSLHPLIQDEISRIGREAIINALQHSNAEKIEVIIEYSNKFFKISIYDDGCGIDSETLSKGREGHWGLRGMKERADKIGAGLRVANRASGGTEVEIVIPGYLAFQATKN